MINEFNTLLASNSNKHNRNDSSMANILSPVIDLYPIFFILTGIAGILMGWDRVWKDDEEESKNLQVLGVTAGALLNVVIILAIYNEDQEISNYSILFGLLLGISLYAKPFRKLPIAFMISSIAGLIIAYFAIVRSNDPESIFAGIRLRWVVLVIVVIMLIVFIIGFIQEQTLDIMLLMLSWGVLVITLSIIMILQGITLLIDFPDTDGILSYLPG